MRRHISSNGRREAGMVTAETAVALPALLLVLAMLVTGTRAVSAQLACQDAARAAARAAARGDSPGHVREVGVRVAPTGADVRVSRSGDLVRVRVVAHVAAVGGWTRRLPLLTVSAEAVAAPEPGTEG